MERLNLDLEGKDGNAFALIGYFRKEAKRAGWKEEEIKKVQDDAMSGEYHHLVATLMDA